MARRARPAKRSTRTPKPTRALTRRAAANPRAATEPNASSWRNDIVLRELFWTNMVREMLTNLSMLSLQARDQADKGAKPPSPPPHHVLDGRIAVITRRGRRLGIADVTPLFACGVGTTEAAREVSMAVECSVFRIVTPEGEVWTLPLSEIRSVHALSEGLLSQIQKEFSATEPSPKPFGFAAFTSLSRGVKGRKRTKKA